MGAGPVYKGVAPRSRSSLGFWADARNAASARANAVRTRVFIRLVLNCHVIIKQCQGSKAKACQNTQARKCFICVRDSERHAAARHFLPLQIALMGAANPRLHSFGSLPRLGAARVSHQARAPAGAAGVGLEMDCARSRVRSGRLLRSILALAN